MELFWPASIWRLSHAEIFQGGKQKKNPKNYNFQNTSLGLFRSDYFYCCDSQRIKQVEFNTIASSFGALSARLVLAQKLVMIHSGQKCLPWVACFWSKMPMLQRAGMRKGGEPLPIGFQYLIFLIYRSRALKSRSVLRDTLCFLRLFKYIKI